MIAYSDPANCNFHWIKSNYFQTVHCIMYLCMWLNDHHHPPTDKWCAKTLSPGSILSPENLCRQVSSEGCDCIVSNETVNPVRVFNNDQRPIINKYTRNASLTDLYRPFVLIAILEIGINRSLRLNIVVNQPVDFTFIPRSAHHSVQFSTTSAGETD